MDCQENAFCDNEGEMLEILWYFQWDKICPLERMEDLNLKI